MKYFTIAGFKGIVIIAQPTKIGIPKIKIVNLVPMTLRRIPEKTHEKNPPNAIIATIHAN